MRTIKILVFFVAAVVGVVAVSRMTLKSGTTHRAKETDNQRSAEPAASTYSPPSAMTDEPASKQSPAEQVPNISDNAPPRETKPDGNLKVAPAPVQAKKPKEPLRDPEARAAMSFVGLDPEAEAYWLGAIFDSSLPDNEREDLMEDLNEEGLSDHKRPGPQDLPVILNRLAIIEEILPLADEFMVTHLGEAYKDLVNLAEITQGGGKPVC